MASAAPRHQFRPPDEPNDEDGDDQCDQEDAREHDPACRLVIRFCGCQHNVTLRCLTRREGCPSLAPKPIPRWRKGTCSRWFLSTAARARHSPARGVLCSHLAASHLGASGLALESLALAPSAGGSPIRAVTLSPMAAARLSISGQPSLASPLG